MQSIDNKNRKQFRLKYIVKDVLKIVFKVFDYNDVNNRKSNNKINKKNITFNK